MYAIPETSGGVVEFGRFAVVMPSVSEVAAVVTMATTSVAAVVGGVAVVMRTVGGGSHVVPLREEQ